MKEPLPLHSLVQYVVENYQVYLIALDTLDMTASDFTSIFKEPILQHQTQSSLHQNIFHTFHILLNLQHPSQLLESYGPVFFFYFLPSALSECKLEKYEASCTGQIIEIPRSKPSSNEIPPLPPHDISHFP